MKILSIDVGIKNLAICLLEVTDSKLYKINNWEVINLCNDTIPKCSCYLSGKKSKNKCDKNAKYTKDGKNYCKTHAKKTEYIIPTTELYSSRLNKCKIAQLYEICAKYNINYEKSINKPKLLETINAELKSKFFDVIETKKADKINLIDLGKNMMQHFDVTLKIKEQNIDYVLIENQISTIATRMKTLQGMLTQYFIMRDIENVEFISSSNKLKDFLDKKKTSYSERKKMGITITNQLISETSLLHPWTETFQKSKKKDDLADCFLQGRWFMKNKDLIE